MAIDSSSIISSLAKIHSSVDIGPFCIIGDNVELGEGTTVLSHSIIKGSTKIGKNNVIYQFSSIGEDTPDKKYEGEDTKLIIGNNNIFREGVTVHRGTVQDKGVTEIGNDNLLMAYTHVAHDCVIGNNNVFANNAGLAGHVIIGNFVILGGYSAVHQFCSLGDHSFLGMNTSVTMDIPAFLKVASNPARIIGLNSVGMNRNEISEESIILVRKAFKLVYKNKLKLNEAIKELKIMFAETNDIHLETFIKSIHTSSRGILR
jgi:UDP-N-acetylglucosamine acyltransferase